MTNLLSTSLFTATLILLAIGCDQPAGKKQKETESINGKSAKSGGFQYVTLLGDSVFAPINPSGKAVAKFEEAKKSYETDRDSAELLIWYGRRAAYIGKYKTAIDLFTEGIGKYPEDPRFYRHRGHRFITTRRFSAAIADFEKASRLIAGKEDRIEPDGIPNRLNTPVSTLHSNIWYHLGLAYYLENDLKNALRSYRACEKVSTNDDMIVSTAHWLYMTLRKLDKTEEAQNILEDIDQNMTIIENDSYHRLCLFYKGMLSEEEINSTEGGDPSGDAVLYGLANWHLYNGNRNIAKDYYKKILNTSNKASFGYIAAESEYKREFK
ncbi:MAG: hypothetical protein WBA74_04310 [Cyclobacteriaceae bacterium]